MGWGGIGKGEGCLYVDYSEAKEQVEWEGVSGGVPDQ